KVKLEGGVHDGVAVVLSDLIGSDAHVVILFEVRAEVMCERRAYLLFHRAITLSDKRVHHDGNDACLRVVAMTCTCFTVTADTIRELFKRIANQRRENVCADFSSANPRR